MNRLARGGVLVGAVAMAACGSSSPQATGGSGSSTGGTSMTGGSGTVTGAVTTSGTTGGPSGTVSTFAGSGPEDGGCGAWGQDGAFGPQMLALDGAGNVYVTSDALDLIAPDGGLTNLTGFTRAPTGMAVTAAGSIFYAESTVNNTSNTAIVELTPNTSYETIFDEPASCDDTGSDAGAPGFGEVAGIAVDPEWNVYVADEACFRVRVFNPDAGTITTLAGTSNQGDRDGPGSMAEFSQLGTIAIDPAGSLYVWESDSARIRKIQPDGTVSTLATNVRGVGGLAADVAGDVYFSVTGANLVRKLDPAGHLSTIAGNGTPGHVDGPSASAELNSPAGLAVDGIGDVYVADTANCYVRIIHQ